MGWVRYDSYTDKFIYEEDLVSTTATYIGCIQKPFEITEEAIDKIADAVVRKLRANQTEPNSSEKPNNYEPRICDTCRYYNSYIPCGSTPSACKKADKFAEEFVEELKKLKLKPLSTISKMEQVLPMDSYSYARGFADGRESMRNLFEQNEPSNSEIPNNFDKDINVRSKTEPMKTTDYCDICKRDMCEFCTADNTNPYCVPSHYEIKQTEQTEREGE